MTSEDWADAQYQAAQLIRKHLWLGHSPDRVRPGWTIARDLSVFKSLAREYGVAEVLGAIGVAREALDLPPSLQVTLLLFIKRGRRDRLHRCIALWRKNNESVVLTNLAAILREAYREARNGDDE